jgi:hypothetical protein
LLIYSIGASLVLSINPEHIYALFYPGTSLIVLLTMEIRLVHSQAFTNSHFHFLVTVKLAVSQVCFSSPVLVDPEVYSELVATTVVSDLCCVKLHLSCWKITSHYRSFLWAGRAWWTGREVLLPRSLVGWKVWKLGLCWDIWLVDLWVGGKMFYLLMLLNPGPSFNHL